MAFLTPDQAEDPFYRFPLSATQLAFARSTARFKAVEGGNRTGKTAVVCWDAAGVFRGIHPFRRNYGPGRYLMLTESRQQMAEVVGRKLFKECELQGPLGRKPFIPPDEIEDIRYQKVPYPVPYKLVMKNGTEVIFAWAGAEATWKRIQGIKLDGAFLDEDAGSKDLINEIFSRLMDVQSDPTRPGGGFVDWSSTPTVGSEALELFRQMCMDPRNTDSQLFHLTPGETGAITAEVLDAQRTRLGEDEARVRVDGTATAADLQAIYLEQWNDERHVRATPYMHSTEDNLWLSYDPGVSHPTGMLILALSPDDPHHLQAVKFFNHKRKTVEYDTQVLKEWLNGRELAGVIYDPAASKKEKSGLSTLTQLQQHFRRAGLNPLGPWRRGRNRHEDGIITVRRYLEEGRFSMAPDPTGELGLQLGRWQLLKYMGRPGTRFTGPGGVVKKNDEFPDCLRYACMARLGYSPKFKCGGRGVASEPKQQIIAPTPSPSAPLTPEQEAYVRHLELSKQAAKKRNRSLNRGLTWY